MPTEPGPGPLPGSQVPRCADTARDRSDPLPGTALAQRRWLLLEHPGPWPFDALGGLGLPEALLTGLVGSTRAAGARTFLVRRPGRRDDGPRRWHVVDGETGGTTSGPWEHDADLAAAMTAVGGGPLHEPPGAGTPRLLVCAHGRHDACCAIRGRPVAAALEERWPGATWECSHVGGDRFAANLVVARDATWYGNLDAASAVDVVERHLDGTVTAEHLRGFGGQPPVVQVAAVAAHRRFGPGGPRDVVAHRVTETGDHRWRIELDCSGPLPARVAVDVVGRRRSAAHLTCHAHVATRAWEWDVEDVVAFTRPSSPRDGGASPAP